MERFHRNLFDQLRQTRLQWSKDINIEPYTLPPESLPWALQHSIFILNNYLAHSSGKTSHFENYRYNYHSNITGYGQIVLGDVRNTPSQKLCLRNQHQKFRGIWLGRDLITNEHILALPLQYSQHPSTTTGAYRCRQITWVPREEQHDNNFLKSIYWPQPSDDIDFNNKEHFNNLQKQNIATRDLQLQQPQDEENIEQPQGVQPPVSRHHPQAVVPQQEQQPPVLQPPPCLPQPPQALLPRPPMVKQQAPPLPAPLLQGPPPKVQAVPVPTPPAVHRPAGKHYNHPRGPPPKAANIIDTPHEDEQQALLGSNLVDISVDSGILQVATNIVNKEQQLQEDLIKQAIEPQNFYEDDLNQYTDDDIKAAIASELHSFRKKNIYGEVDIDSLTPEQQHRIIKTRWVIGPRPSSTSVDDIDPTIGPLKARFVAKGYSQHISDHIKETFAASPSSTSLRTLLLHAVLHQYQVTSRDVSSAFLNTPIEEDIHVQPPPEIYEHRPRVIWNLHRALYGLRTSTKMWQEHLHSTLRGLHLQQLKADRCVWVKANIMVLAYVDDLLIAGTSRERERETSLFLEQLQQSFSLKHSTVLTPQQPPRFLGKHICRHPNGDITVSLERSYCHSMLKHMGLDDNINPTFTPSLRRPPVQQDAQLDPDRHHIYRKVVGMLIWASLVRPDLQFTAKDHTRHLAAPTEWDWTHLKHTAGRSREHSTTSSSSHLGYLKDIHYHFDSSSRCTSTHIVILTGTLTSSQGSLPQAQSHQYLEYLLHSTAEHSLQPQRRVLKPNSTPSTSASVTAYTSTSYFKNFHNIFNDQPSTSATLTLSTTSTSLTSTKSPIHIFTDSTSALSLSNKLQAWPQQKVQAHRVEIPLRPGHPSYWTCEHPEGYVTRVSHRQFWSDIFVTTVSLNCTSKRGRSTTSTSLSSLSMLSTSVLRQTKKSSTQENND